MVKKFKDVFQSLECAPHMDELLNFVSVEKVTARSDMTDKSKYHCGKNN